MDIQYKSTNIHDNNHNYNHNIDLLVISDHRCYRCVSGSRCWWWPDLLSLSASDSAFADIVRVYKFQFCHLLTFTLRTTNVIAALTNW